MKKNYLKRKVEVFDGIEDEFIKKEMVVKCPSCGLGKKLKISAGISINKLSESLKKDLIESLMSLKKVQVADSVFYRVEGLSLQFQSYTCSGCMRDVLVVYGAGEYQPARYMAILSGIFCS